MDAVKRLYGKFSGRSTEESTNGSMKGNREILGRQ